MATNTTGPQSLNGAVTFLVPFKGNRMNAAYSDGTIHILKREELSGSRTWCELTVETARTKYSQRTRLAKSEEEKLHGACFTAYLNRPVNMP